jgi:hypothetical protein
MARHDKPRAAPPSLPTGELPRDEALWPLGRYRLTAPHYMRPQPQAEHALVLREGAEVSFAGRPSRAMEPLDAPARQALERRTREMGAS